VGGIGGRRDLPGGSGAVAPLPGTDLIRRRIGLDLSR
jgi:hypothetical protein